MPAIPDRPNLDPAGARVGERGARGERSDLGCGCVAGDDGGVR